MSPALAAVFVLFNGHNLDGWKVLHGEWIVGNNAIACVNPGAIRSSFESDGYKLSFDYHLPKDSKCYVYVGADQSGRGGRKELLGEAAIKAKKLPGHKLGYVNGHISLSVTADQRRGFIVFEADKSGLEIRDIKVEELGFTSLFDGKSLKGWETVGKEKPGKPNWTVEDGVLMCGHYVGYGNWLRTVESYENFIIRLEYWLPPKGNSGVYLHAPLEGRISQIGQEIQLLDNAGYPKTKAAQKTGSVYAGIAPEVDVPCPAQEWNAIEIFSQGKRIRTTLNGVQLYDASLDDEKKDQQLLHHPLSTRRLTGFIGLQDHTGGPKFRNIRIRTLPATSKPAKDE